MKKTKNTTLPFPAITTATPFLTNHHKNLNKHTLRSIFFLFLCISQTTCPMFSLINRLIIKQIHETLQELSSRDQESDTEQSASTPFALSIPATDIFACEEKAQQESTPPSKATNELQLYFDKIKQRVEEKQKERLQLLQQTLSVIRQNRKLNQLNNQKAFQLLITRRKEAKIKQTALQQTTMVADTITRQRYLQKWKQLVNEKKATRKFEDQCNIEQEIKRKKIEESKNLGFVFISETGEIEHTEKNFNQKQKKQT